MKNHCVFFYGNLTINLSMEDGSMVVKILLLLIFFAVTITVGLIARRRVSSVNDFVLGGRGIGAWLSAFSYGTSYFSAVVFVGYAGQFGWSYGVAAVWIGLGNAFIGSLMAWAILGERTRSMTKYLDTSTMPEFFEKRYSSKAIKLVASLIVFVFLIPYSASVYKGLSGIFTAAFNIDFVYCVIGMAVLTAIYVVLGGYVASSINDFIQGIIMLFGIVAVVVSVLNGKGGFAESLTLLSKQEVVGGSSAGMQGGYVSFFGPEPAGLLGVVILTSLGPWGLPHMIHKFYSIKDGKAIRKGTIISTLFALIIAGGSYFMGAFGRLYVNSDANGLPEIGSDNIVPTMLSSVLPDILIGIIVVLILSASMSTLSSLVISSSSTFTIDFVKGFLFKKIDGKKQMLIIRIMSAFFILISVIIALFSSELISGLMSISWGALAGAFLAPFLYGLFWKGVTKIGVWAGFVTGISITVINIFTKTFIAPTAGAIAMLVSLVVVPLVSLITPKLDKEYVNKCFACFEEKKEKTESEYVEQISVV